MKKLENIKLIAPNEQPYVDEQGNQIDSLACIKAVLNGCEYKTREDQRNADKLYFKLAEMSGETIELEDAEFSLVKRYAMDYKPFLNGRMFVPFLNSLEEAE